MQQVFGVIKFNIVIVIIYCLQQPTTATDWSG